MDVNHLSFMLKEYPLYLFPETNGFSPTKIKTC